jgi:outer membrane protein assembly factor BamB
VLALDGKSGQVLWHVGARNQVVGSPVFKDITNDDTDDVFIGGRSAVLYCIDGNSGKMIWEFLPSNDSLDIYNDTTVLNFYNPQFIPDVSGDGVDELLVAYGGFIKAKPNDLNRPTGYLMIVNTVTGDEIIRAAVPDRRETYMSPVIYDFNGDGILEIIFGTGGETIDGHLYKVAMTSLLKGNISDAIELDSGGGKGFIAPVVLADVTSDEIPDILVNSVNGRAICLDGSTNKKLWEVSMGDGFEIYTSPGPGNFNGDQTPDFFISFGKGLWPKIENSVNVAIDGKSGNIFFQETLGTFQYASPIVIDITGDGMDDVLFSLNIPSIKESKMASIPYLENRLMVFDIHNKMPFVFDKPKLGTNLGSTPLMADLDHDGKLDVIYCYSTDASDSSS